MRNHPSSALQRESSSTHVRSSNASGRVRAKFISTMTSVPPQIAHGPRMDRPGF
jgi:hypothetical protein